MFRDTFAVENLLAGVTLEKIALLLGHSGIKTTERHYAPFLKARQSKTWRSSKHGRRWRKAERSRSCRRIHRRRFFFVFSRTAALASFKLTRVMTLLFAMHPHAPHYFFPSLRRFRHFVGARFDLHWRIGFTIAKFAIHTQRDLRRREAISGFSRLSSRCDPQGVPCGQFPTRAETTARSFGTQTAHSSIQSILQEIRAKLVILT
jgi:hypothetical protein